MTEIDHFTTTEGRPVLAGESEGEGPDVFLCHGLSATRRYVTHGSHALPRAGFRVHTYDARGHGESEPAPEGEGYSYDFLAGDLDRIVRERSESDRVVVGGHSMGCHSAAAWAIGNPERVAAMILIGPVYDGTNGTPDDDRWDARADALLEGGPERFAEEVAGGFDDPEVAGTVRRLALERARLHRSPEALAVALREVPRSRPFDSLDDLAQVGAPTLVIGSRDRYDPGHPMATARLWADVIDGSRFEIEAEGDSPLSWQGGRLSRLIASFLSEVLGSGVAASGGGGSTK